MTDNYTNYVVQCINVMNLLQPIVEIYNSYLSWKSERIYYSGSSKNYGNKWKSYLERVSLKENVESTFSFITIHLAYFAGKNIVQTLHLDD